jgi:hypothetical protein
MVGSFDQVLGIAAAAPLPVALVTAAPILQAPDLSRFPFPPSPRFTPETPPPIVA